MKLKKVLLSTMLILTTFIAFNQNVHSQDEAGPLVVYTYSSLISFGLADVLASEFEAQVGEEVQFVATSDSRAMLSRLISERDAQGAPPADVFVGVEVSDLSIARENDVFEAVSTEDVPNREFVYEPILFDSENKLIPYEHGYITLVYNSDEIAPEDVPQTLKDLIDPKFRDEIIMIDPRTSSPGLSFLLWTIAEFGEESYLGFWDGLKENILTITNSWDTSFDFFFRGEASIIVSFSTDEAFDVIFNDSMRTQVLTPEGQGYRTIFGAGLVKGAERPELGKAFLNVLLSEEVQSAISETEYMIPANINATARAIWFQNVVIPENPLLLPEDRVAENLDIWLDEWVDTVLTN